MDEKYLQDLYNWIVTKDPAYKTDIPFQNFKQKMSDPNYVGKMHSWISSIDPTFKRDMTIDKFVERVGGGKKKVDTGSFGVDGSLEPAKIIKPQPQRAVAESTSVKPIMMGTPSKKAEGDDGQGWLMNTVSAIDRGFYKNLIGNPVKGLGTLLEMGTAKITGGSGKGFLSDALIDFGDYFNKTIDELAPMDEEFKSSLSNQFFDAFGQVASMALTYGASGAGAGASATATLLKNAPKAAAATGATKTAGIIGTTKAALTPAVEATKILAKEMASPAAVSAGLSMGQAEFDRAKQAGATDEQAFEAFWKNAAVGSVLEKVPVMQFFKRFNKASAGGITNYLKTKAVGGLTGGVEEMTTEVLQQIYSNATAKDIYNINQELFEGVGTSGGVGFGVGFLLNAMGANAKILRKEGRTEEAKIVEDQIKELETQAQRGGPSSYSFNGIKIQPVQTESGIKEPREVISDMINNMSAADLSKANLEIVNDPELKLKLQDKIVTSSIKEQAREANPNLSDEQLDEITNLEKELRKLEGNTTQIGKDRAASIRSQIKTIQENAVQKQAAGEVPVQPKAGVGEEVAQGKPQAEPQGPAVKGQELSEETKSLLEIRTKVIEDGIAKAESLGNKEEVEQGKLQLQKLKTDPVGYLEDKLNELKQFKNEDGTLLFSTTISDIEKALPELKGQAAVTAEAAAAEPVAKTEAAPKPTVEGVAQVFLSNPDYYRFADVSGTNIIGNENAIAEMYVAAKEDGSNPKLVEEVESLIKPFYQPEVQVVAAAQPQPTVTRINVAPFFNTQVASAADAKALREFPEYKQYVNSLNELAKVLNVPMRMVESIGGYKNDAGEEITEISSYIELENASMEQAEEFAALAAVLAPEVQEASIAAQYVEQGAPNHNANEYVIVVPDTDAALAALKAAGITDFSINEETGEVSFIDVFDFKDAQLQEKIGTFVQNLERNNINYEQSDYQPLDSRRIGKGERKKILGRIREKGTQLGEGGQDLLQTIEQAERRDAEFQGVKPEEYYKPTAGNRLFNQPLKAVAEIADRYFQRVFGKPRPRYYGSKSLDTERAKRIADAFANMKNDPNNPEVKAAYEALAKETLDQYQAFLDAGYKVEINNEEPYANSQEMIDDLRNRKVIKIFSTESGFGDTPITDQQRADNPLLKDSGLKDVNGQPMLINDVFRAIHDFFGHAELGNSFGPKGEENAWNIHARMFSPEARKAMTTETRGQNSYVNFSGVNDRIEKMREEARKLREEGDEAGAQEIVQKIYEEMSFADQKVGLLPEEFYQIDETDMGDADRIPEAEVMEEISQELTEEDLPGYDRMMQEIDGIIEKSENRGVPFNKIMDNVMEYMKKSKAYEGATDVQREALVRDIRSRFKKKEKRAPSAKKILGEKKTEVTVDEMAALKDQIKLEARAAREAKQDINAKRKALADYIRGLVKDSKFKGKLTLNKVNTIINKISKLNLDSQIAVDKFIDYAGKVFADADYANKLSAANETRRQIKKLSKNKDKFANLRDLGSRFSEIDPSMVEDINEYNRIAALVKDSIKGSTSRGPEAKFANMVKDAEVTEYINTTIEEQKKKMFDMKVAEIQELLGVDASNLTYEQLLELAEKKEPMTKDNEKLLRDAINKAFDIYSSLIEASIRSGKDVFTGEDVEYTANQKRVVKEFMNMDLNVLKPKQALEAVDALMNFLQNQSVAKMESVVAKYTGEQNAIQMEKKGIKAKPIRKYWSKGLGRLLIEQTANLNILFERMFGGFTRGGLVEELTGVTAIKNGKSKAQSEANKIVDKYVEKFYKSKPNGKAFNTAANNTERGMVAFMMRNVIGTDQEMKAEFDRRKGLIEESIEVLSNGNDQEVERANVYKEIYDKVLADSESIDDVVSKADKTNVEAVKFWQSEWDNKYEQLSDVALGVYNKVLGKDINYNPDRFTRLSSDTGDVELSTEDMTFIFNSGNAPIYKKETGVLMAATRPESLPRNEKNGEVNRFIDLSFDNNNANSMYDALVDINTAAPIRQVESALNSAAFRRIVPETGDRRLLENRVKLYVNNIRKKNPFSNDEFSRAVKGLNRLASIGVGQALGGVLQPIKQTIPIAMNTLINAGGLDIQSVFSKSKQDFINKSGFAIANRGVESQAQIESLNKMLDEASKSKPEQAFKAIEKVNNWWLKNLLVRFDVAIARASWMTYYEQSLKKQGIDPNSIDYNTHEINQEAADYAQRQVDRQQNVSDADLAGALLSSKDAKTQLFVKILMPFASFRMNQSARLGADLATLTDKNSTVEDKKVAARSLAGFAAEMTTFRVLSAGSALLIAEFVKEVMGREDDEEKDKKKMDSIIKGQLTSTVADLFSPAPLLDKMVQMGASTVLDATQDALEVDEDERLEIYSGNKQDFFQSLGLLGIAGARANQLWEMTKLSMGMPYEDDYGRKKYLSEEDREIIGELVPFAILSNIGLVPSEVNSVIMSAIGDAKRNASTVEGGKSRADVDLEKREAALSSGRKEKTEENKSNKIEALKKMKMSEFDDAKLRVIDDMLEDLEMSDEQKKSMASSRKREKLEKAEKMKELLQGYDNKTDMKRYDPELYERTFGENSDYYRENKAEMEVEKQLSKELRKMEDEEMGYTPSGRKSRYRIRTTESTRYYRRSMRND